MFERMKRQSEYYLVDNRTTLFELELNNYDNLVQKLNKPFDTILPAIIDVTMQTVAEKVPGCKLLYGNREKIILLIDNLHTMFDGKVQDIISYISSEVSINFYKNFMTFILEYQENVNATIENYSEEHMQIINDRISLLWSILDECPTFKGMCMSISENFNYSERLATIQEESRVSYMKEAGKFYLNEYSNDMTYEVIFMRLLNEGYNFEEIIPEQLYLGTLVFSDGENWVSQTSPRFSERDDIDAI